jgi:hypothetical protein
MAGTMAMGNLYPGRASTQESVNSGGTAKVPTRGEMDVPIFTGLASWAGVSLWVLLMMGVFGWWLLEFYD